VTAGAFEADDIIAESIEDASDICEDIIEESMVDEAVSMAEDEVVSAAADDEVSIIADEEDAVSIMEDEEDASWDSAPVTRTAVSAVVAKSRRSILVSLGSTRVEQNRATQDLAGYGAARFLDWQTPVAARRSLDP
jgi:hypothetical protein